MFTAALFTIAKIWKQSSTDEDVRYKHTHTHTHTMEYYSDKRKKETLAFVTVWMKLEGITLN